MKKVFIAMLTGLMLVGCAQTTNQPAAEATAEATAETTAAPAETAETAANQGELLGGWTVNEEFNAVLTDDETARFEKALEGLTGVGYEPIQVLATQVVNGLNYAYLAKGTTVTKDPQSGYYIVVVNEDGTGKTISLVNIAEIDIADVKTTTANDAQMSGAWEITDTGKAGMLPGEDAQTSFDAATANSDILYNPVVLLGSQVVAGVKYGALCRGKTADDKLNLYYVTWVAGADGTNELVESNVFDLLSYVTVTE